MLTAISEHSASEQRLLEAATRKLHDCIDQPDTLRRVQNTVSILESLRADVSVIIAALLTPLIRENHISGQEIATTFGSRCATLAHLTVKLLYQENTLEQRRKASQKVKQADQLRRYLIYTYTDFQMMLIVAADRLASGADIERMSPHEQQNWGEENLSVYLPIFEMLGLWVQRRTLGNLSLKVVNPSFYRQLERAAINYHERYQDDFEDMATALRRVFEEQAIHNTSVTLHDTTPISLYQRMTQARRQGRKYNRDEAGKLSIDIIMESVRDCYHALGLVHNLWRPAHAQGVLAEGRFRDYIAAPRYNGYRCLITTVLHERPSSDTDRRPSQQLVEFRLRTRSMELVNTHGIAAAAHSMVPVKNAWWTDRQLIDRVKLGNTEQQQQHSTLCVFTPTGEVLHGIPNGSTMVDLAFRIHSTLGPYARRFYANGKLESFSYELKHRDLVEIEYDQQFASLTGEWEEFARTSQARKGIQRFLRQQDQSAHKGRQIIDKILERETSIYQMRLPETRIEHSLKKIAREHNTINLDSLYVRVLEGEIAPDTVVSSIIENELIGHIIMADGCELPTRSIHIAQTWMQEKEDRKFHRDSRVIPGVDIVGRLEKDRNPAQLTVYRADSPHLPTDGDLIPLAWRASNIPREIAEITVAAPQRSNTVGMVLNAIYAVNKDDDAQHLEIHRFQAELKDGSLIINFVVDAPSLDDILDLEKRLKVIQRGAYINEFKIWQLFPGQRIAVANRLDRRRKNPYTLKQIRDQSMFFGREEEINKIINAFQNEQHFCVIYGQKRIGKTSLMVHLVEHILPQVCDVLPVFLDAQGIADINAENFLLGLADAARERVYEVLKRSDERRGLRLRERDLEGNPFAAFAQWVARVENRLKGTRLLFLIDEFTRTEELCRAGQLDSSFFDGLQWLVGNQNIAFVLCVHDHVYKFNSRSWGLLQRGDPVRLEMLDRESAARLVRQPLERLYDISDELVEYILELTACYPFFIQAICYSLTTFMAQQEHHAITREDVIRATNKVLVTGDHYFSHFCADLDEFSLDVLKILAYITNDDQPWASSDEMRAAMVKLRSEVDSKRFYKSIGDLRNARVIEAENGPFAQAIYRIPVGMFRIWLQRVVTHVIVSQDSQRKD